MSPLGWKWAVGGGLAAAFLGGQALKELDPLAGSWTPESAWVDGREVTPMPAWRLYLEVSDRRHVVVATWWPCGVRSATYAEGTAVERSDRIDLYRENWATGERDAAPCATLSKLPGTRLGFSFSEEGEKIDVVFRRDTNAETLFDLFDWRK